MRTFFCPTCGSVILPGMSRCPDCGMPFDGGEWVKKETDAPSPKLVGPGEARAPFLPYEPRPEQLRIIADIRDALDRGRHIVIESGTGTGKTVVSLAGALEHARPLGKKVVYVTRTISQADQVMRELKAISTIRPVCGITLTGRGKSCPLLESRPDFTTLTPNVLSTMCSERKQRSTNGQAGGCPYFERVEGKAPAVGAYCRRNFPRSEELDAYCKNMNVCPYEAKKLLLKGFDVVVAPYIHIIDPDIRDNFLQNLGIDDNGITLVVDEAHNLMDAVREQESFSITDRLVGSARDEASILKRQELSFGVGAEALALSVKAALRELSGRHIPFGKREALLPDKALEGSVCRTLNITADKLGAVIAAAVDLGRKREQEIADSDAPSSPFLELAELLDRWVRSPAESYVKAVRADGDGAFLTASCIDPTDIVRFMQALPGAVHMSGTLQPLAQYASVMGLPKNAVPRTYPSPFPRENRLVVYAKGVTTNYGVLKSNPAMMAKIERTTAQLCNAVDKNTIVFLPSYRVMKDIRRYMEDSIDRPLYWEESGRQRRTMSALERFRAGRDGVFFCVMGGSVAEGMDFPGDELSFAIVVGMPYPPPSLEMAAMKSLFDARYGPGMGWKYTSEVPAVRKIRQAVGRLIRTETDRGMAVILDERAARNARQLEAVPTADPVGDAVRFFSEGRRNRSPDIA